MTELKKRYHKLAPKYYPARQRLTLPPKEGQKSGEVLKDGSKLSECGLTNGSVVQFKDLGTQVGVVWQASARFGPVSCGQAACQVQAAIVVGQLVLQVQPWTEYG